MAVVDDWFALLRYYLFHPFSPMVMVLPALITYSTMQCWRRKAGNILRPQAGDYTTENHQPPYHQSRVEHVHIHPEIYEQNACGRVDQAAGAVQYEPEKTNESVKTEVTQLTSINRGDDDGAVDDEEGRIETWLRHKQEMKKRRDWESIQRARARLCYAKKVRPEEDTLYEVDDEEMPEVDFTAAFYAKLKAEHDKSDLC